MTANRKRKIGRPVPANADTGDFGISTVWQLGQRQPRILERLSEHERRIVLAKSQRRKLTGGEHLFLQGDGHRGTYVIEKGLVRTYYTSPAGREVTLAYWLPGNLVGTPDLFGDSTHMWSGVAEADTEAIFIAGDVM